MPAPRSYHMTFPHRDGNRVITLVPADADTYSIFEDGIRLGWLESRAKPLTKTRREYRGKWLTDSGETVHGDRSPVRADAITDVIDAADALTGAAAVRLLTEPNAPAPKPPRNAVHAHALATAAEELKAAEEAREIAVTRRRAAVAAALKDGIPRAEIAAMLGVTRQMVDRLAD